MSAERSYGEIVSTTESLDDPRRRRVWLGLVLSGVGGFLCWAAWLGCDLHYDIDPVTGDASGPYERWQVVGSAVSLLVLVVIIGLSMKIKVAFASYALIAVVYMFGFCLSAVIQENFNPDMGADFWPLGAALLLVGAGTGIFAAGALVCLLRIAMARRSGRRCARGAS